MTADQTTSTGSRLALTARERDVASLLIDGITVAAIAERLRISVHTARMHVKHMHEKAKTHTLHGLALALALLPVREDECCLASLIEDEGHRPDRVTRALARVLRRAHKADHLRVVHSSTR